LIKKLRPTLVEKIPKILTIKLVSKVIKLFLGKILHYAKITWPTLPPKPNITEWGKKSTIQNPALSQA
jgi:hypothetical protein